MKYVIGSKSIHDGVKIVFPNSIPLLNPKQTNKCKVPQNQERQQHQQEDPGQRPGLHNQIKAKIMEKVNMGPHGGNGNHKEHLQIHKLL